MVGEGEVELLLGLRQREGVGGGRAAADLLRHPEVLGQRVDLGLVEVGDGLEVGRAVALLHEEALVVLEAVGRSRHGVVEPVGVVVGHHGARPLLEVGGRHQLQVGRRRGADGALVAGRVRHRQRGEVEPVALEDRADDDLAAPPGAVLRHHHADGLLLPRVAAESPQGGRDVLHHRLDAEAGGQRPTKPKRVVGGVALRHEEPEDLLRAEGADAE